MKHLAIVVMSTCLLGCGGGQVVSSTSSPAELPEPVPARRPDEKDVSDNSASAPLELPDRLKVLARKAWIPEVTVAGSSEHTPAGSRFGGRPWLPNGVAWPVCPGCDKAMHLFCQLAVDTLPGDVPLPSGKLLQLFYCTNTDPLCEDDLSSYEPFGRAVVARLVEAVDDAGAGSLGETSDIEPFAARPVRAWSSREDLPHPTELDELDVEVSSRVEDHLFDAELNSSATKWLGWPNWVQSVEYPRCRRCDCQMTYLLQIESDGLIPVGFGDMGIGHLSVCPFHPEEMSFHWAC